MATRHLRPVDDGGRLDPDAAAKRAWRLIAASFDEALAVEGLAEDTRSRLTRCRRHARHCAGLRCLSPTPSTTTDTMED